MLGRRNYVANFGDTIRARNRSRPDFPQNLVKLQNHTTHSKQKKYRAPFSFPSAAIMNKENEDKKLRDSPEPFYCS
jgi:hypothetical protein